MTVQSDVSTKEPQDFNDAFDEFSQVDNAAEEASLQPGASGEVAADTISADTTSADTTSADTTSADTTSADTTSADTTSQEELKILIEGLRSEITQLKQGQQTQEKLDVDDGKTDDLPLQDERGLLADEEWHSLKEDLPEVANVMEAQKKQIDLLSEQVKTVTEQSVQQYQAQQIGIMDKAIPEWRNVIGNNEFVKWVQDQPEQVQQIIDSPQASEVSWLINLYKQQSASDIKERRQQAAQSAVEIPTKNSGARPSGSVPEDFNAAFDYYSKQG